jgi:pimeloyl-ACP methyl ester carboxylesterase
MMNAQPKLSEHFVTVADATIQVTRRGNGPPLMLLPGEEGLEGGASVVGQLAASHEVITLWPPGFGKSNRPDWITNVDDIAYLYLDVLKKLQLQDVPVVGFSLGGWIAAEMATKDQSRIAKLVLVAPYGIKVGGPMDRDIQDIWTLPPEKVAGLKWFDVAKGKRDFKSMADDELTIVARNTESFARFCWQPYMHNPKLKHRLHSISVPTLLIWGERDGIVTTDYGAAYSRLIPGATIAVISEAGHLPHIEQPTAFMKELAKFL